ncbi:MAG: hypothetical protein JNM76_01095 [Betaproteobacteria bacterium]|nr:hypothetical protein [Betaproteobacteria bacterium]
MNPLLIFSKTVKGREEIEKRTWRIDSRRRMMLIMVDGMHSVEDLAAKSASPEDAMTQLQSLWTDGFVEPADGSVSAGQPAPTPVASAPLTTARSLEALQRAASRAISDLLGPEGENMALRLERTKSVEQFLVEAQRTREALKDYVGARKAEAFWNALGL